VAFEILTVMFATRRKQNAALTFFRIFFLAVAVPPLLVETTKPSIYPNELPNFRFYEKYLKPLRPYISDHASVVRVLGSDQGIDLDQWKIRPYFVGDGKYSTVAPELIGRSAEVGITPKQRVSLINVRFPKAYTHSYGGISGINVSCDVYSDKFGLQYWIFSEDSKLTKRQSV
jgi:hypothetical protein